MQISIILDQNETLLLRKNCELFAPESRCRHRRWWSEQKAETMMESLSAMQSTEKVPVVRMQTINPANVDSANAQEADRTYMTRSSHFNWN